MQSALVRIVETYLVLARLSKLFPPPMGTKINTSGGVILENAVIRRNGHIQIAHQIY